MKATSVRRRSTVGLIAVILAGIVAQPGVAADTDDAVIADLQRQIDKLKAQVAGLTAVKAAKKKKAKAKPGPAGAQGPAGPQGPAGAQGLQGPAGTEPACEGNGSGDAMVAAGAVCIDKYEASIWTAPEGGTQIIGAIPCNANGQDCDNIFARSVPGVRPSNAITWFQAQAALANVGKRLPSNAEWQQAVSGTPDPGPDNGTTDCNSTFQPGEEPTDTGSRSACVSRFGAFDMVGNHAEWVADWVPLSTTCLNWDSAVSGFSSDDLMCLAGARDFDTPDDGPGVPFRGGAFNSQSSAGPFSIWTRIRPSDLDGGVGFRGVR
jgi:formylglycine-generating enzyme required for sulfatase activity